MERTRTRRKNGNTHISLAAIKQYLQDGTYPDGSTPCDKRSVRKRAESFKIEDEELFYIVRPKRIEGEPMDPNPGANKANLRLAILTQKAQLVVANSVHAQNGGSHRGTERTLTALSSKYYWVGMANTVKKIVKNCLVCLANRPQIANFPSTPSQSSATTSQASEPDASSQAVPQDFLLEKKEEISEPDPVERMEDGEGGEIQYIELSEPGDVDADLDFVKEMQNRNCSAAADPVFLPASDFDSARRFWQKVEILALGPFPHKKKTAFVIAVMDSFSKWPEVHIVNRLNVKTFSQICLKLIARFGVMEQLILLQSKDSASEHLDPSGICQNLMGISVAVSIESVSVFGDSWNILVNNVQRFIKTYRDNWFDCLDICLLPLRNTVTHSTDYTPSFLFTGREPLFPEVLLQDRNSSDEVVLNKDQIEQIIDSAMDVYLQCYIPDSKQILPSDHVIDRVFESPLSKSPVRKSGRKTKKYHRLAGFDDDGIDGDDDEGSDVEDMDVVSKNIPSTSEEKEPVSISTKKKKHTGTVLKSKHNSKTASLTKAGINDEDKSAEQEKAEDVLEKVDLDTYYSIIYLYKKEGAYPANSTPTFKRTVRRSCESFILENGRLMHKLNGNVKEVVTTMDRRLALMEEAHVDDGSHISRAKTLEVFESKNVFWKGMTADIQAFVAACPECKRREPQRRNRTSKRALRGYRGAGHDSDSNEEINSDLGKVLYEALIDYLKKDIAPDGLTRSELLTFRKRAKNYLLKKGVLYFCQANGKDVTLRRVLRTEGERQEALKEAHGEKHADLRDMKSSLRQTVFWPRIAEDAERFLSSCSCQPKPPAEDRSDEDKSLSLDVKIKCFQDYFAGMNVCPKPEPLDSLFPKTETPSNPLRDLVAAAMESAKLTTSSMQPDSAQTQKTPVVVCSSAAREHLNSSYSDHSELMQPGSSMVCKRARQERARVKNSVSDYEDEFSDDDDDDDNDDDESQLMEDDDRDEAAAGQDVKPHIFQGEQNNGVRRISNARRRCEVCLAVVKGDNNFKEHMYKHTKVKPFSCSICGKKFTSMKGVKMHARRHTGHRPYLCNICGRGFPRSASLRYHIKTHDRAGGVPIVCDICNRTFTTDNRLQKHKRFKHPVESPVFRCEMCGRVFTAKRSLKRHEEAHQGIRKYECGYCHRSFFRKEYLNYHLVSHSNEDPTLANFKLKSRYRKMHVVKKREPATTGLSIVCLNPAEIPVTQDQEVCGQLVEVAEPQEWTEGERSLVYEFNSDQRAEDGTIQHVAEDGTTYVVMEGQPNSQGSIQVRHIIVPSDHMPHHKQMKQITIHPHHNHHQQLQQQQHRDAGRAQSFEVTLPSGTHTFTFPSSSSSQFHATDADTVHYQVECLPGDTLTEDDFNAIRVLAQASLNSTHLVQQ